MSIDVLIGWIEEFDVVSKYETGLALSITVFGYGHE